MASTATPERRDDHEQLRGRHAKIDKTVNLGSPTSPQMIYFKGEYDPSSNFVGRGRRRDPGRSRGTAFSWSRTPIWNFFQTGNFRWDGIVLVTGRNVSRGLQGRQRARRSGVPSSAARRTPWSLAATSSSYNRTTDTMIVRASKQNIDMALQRPLQHARHLVSGSMQYVPLLIVAVAATALALGCEQAPARPAVVADCHGAGAAARFPGRSR